MALTPRVRAIPYKTLVCVPEKALLSTKMGQLGFAGANGHGSNHSWRKGMADLSGRWAVSCHWRVGAKFKTPSDVQFHSLLLAEEVKSTQDGCDLLAEQIQQRPRHHLGRPAQVFQLHMLV
jgi:hypothetical protein